MSRVAFIFSMFMLLIGCSDLSEANDKKHVVSIEEELIEIVLRDDLSDSQIIKAYLLLSNLILEEPQLLSLNQKLASENLSPLEALMINYLLWIQTQETAYINGFVQSFPVSKDLSKLNKAISNSEYRVAVSPLQDLLSFFAFDDDEALIKLIKSVEYVDGAHAEKLNSQLQNIYKADKNRFTEASSKLGFKLNEIIK